MDLSTKIPLMPVSVSAQLSSSFFTIGSCFSENIGAHLIRLKRNTVVNPYGILFNPISIAQSLLEIMDSKTYTSNDLVHFNEKYLSLNHSTLFSNANEKACLENINNEIEKACKAIVNTRFLIITFGSAYVYKHIGKQAFVANCHKIPQKEFEKKRLNQAQIIEAYEEVFFNLKKINKDIQIIFTVSPVRHWKDGAVNNQRSKAILIDTCHQLIEKHPHCYYFPAYEIMMDELRDYRFYADDMLHPSKLAIEIIWKRFLASFYDEETQENLNEIDKIVKSFEHAPFDTNTKSYRLFKQNLKNKVVDKGLLSLFSEELKNLD